MENTRDRLSELLSSLESNGTDVSRATSPGGEPREANDVNGDGQKRSRNRPRTYPYFRYLPYSVESEAERQQNFEEILKHLYIAVEAADFSPGAVHWTRELRNWLGLKFDPTKEQRVKLVRLYYELALAPGIDASVSERFSSMFMVLTKYVEPNLWRSCILHIAADEFQAEALPTPPQGYHSGLETNIPRIEGLRSPSRIRYDSGDECQAELPDLDEVMQLCSALF